MSFFRKSKIEVSKEVREIYSSPSFSYQIGPSYIVSSPQELRDIIEKNNRPVVLLFPSVQLFEYPHEYEKALSMCSFLIVAAEDDRKEIKDFVKRMERKVFSPVQKTISGVLISKSQREALSISSSMNAEAEGRIITVYLR